MFDFRGFEVLQKAVTLGSSDPEASAMESALGQWQNVVGQISLIKQAVLAPTEIFSFGKINAPHVLTEAPEALRPLLDSTWNNQILMETLVRAGTGDDAPIVSVKEVFDQAIIQAPELVALGLTQIGKPWSAFHEEVLIRALVAVFGGREHSSFVLHRAWQADSALVIRALGDMYQHNASTLPKILDIALETNVGFLRLKVLEKDAYLSTHPLLSL